MNQSFPKTIEAPGPLPLGKQPAVLARADEHVMQRVLVRNLDEVHPLFIAVEVQSLMPEIQSDTFELPPGTSEVFPLAPDQKLYGRAEHTVTAGVRVSVFTSDAFPVEVFSKDGA